MQQNDETLNVEQMVKKNTEYFAPCLFHLVKDVFMKQITEGTLIQSNK